MDRKEFDSLNIEEQVEYINKELYSGLAESPFL